MAARYDFKDVDQGATFDRTLWYYAGPGQTNPVNLTGYRARMQVRKTLSSPDKLLDLTTENGGISLGTTNGQIHILAEAEAMDAVPAGRWFYDIELVSGAAVPDETVKRLFQGRFVVKAQVTR